MSPHSRNRLLAAALAIAIAGGVWWVTRSPEIAPPSAIKPAAGVATIPPVSEVKRPSAPDVGAENVATPRETTTPASSPIALPPVLASPQSVASTPPSGPVQNTPETLATERMIVAHAPLRAPAVADPDSQENRVVLQAMLRKALLRKEQPPPSK